jgi:hypothetical protein
LVNYPWRPIAIGYYCDFDLSTSTFYGNDSTALLFGGDAHVDTWLSRDTSIQLDVQGHGTTSIDQGGYSYYDWDGHTGGIFGAHFSWRDPQSHLFGVFGGFSGQSNLDYSGTMTHGIVGVEGQLLPIRRNARVFVRSRREIKVLHLSGAINQDESCLVRLSGRYRTRNVCE